MVSVTGQFIFATLLALSQFVQPYAPEKAQQFLHEQCEKKLKKQKKTKLEAKSLCDEKPEEHLEQWMVDAYLFKPLSPDELLALTPGYQDLMNEYDVETSYMTMARYLRAACVRLTSSAKTEKSVSRGRLSKLRFKKMLDPKRGLIEPGLIEKFQGRILPEEQHIVLLQAPEFIISVCDVEEDLMEIAHFGLRQGLDMYRDYYYSLPQIFGVNDLPRQAEVSFVFDKAGSAIGEISYKQVNKQGQVVKRNRRRLPEGTVPDILKKALVSVEDARFWNFVNDREDPKYKGHRGVDFKGILRAGKVTSSGKGVQGASTLTMQLVKNLLLYEDVFNEHSKGKRSLVRKLKEYILARRIEEALDKSQILDWYYNVIDFGRGAQGIVMAAKSYFGKDLESFRIKEGQSSDEVAVIIAEAAFLAGLPKAPNNLDPAKNYEKALSRRNKVLKHMKNEGHISSGQYKQARALSIQFIPSAIRTESYGYAQHYMNAVEKQMKDWLKETDQYEHLGFDITVPIDHDMQKWAVESLQRGLLAYERSANKLTAKADEDQLPNLKERIDELVDSKIQELMASRPPVQDEEILGEVVVEEIELDRFLTEEEIAAAEEAAKTTVVVTAPKKAPEPTKKPTPPEPKKPLVVAPSSAPAPFPNPKTLRESLPMQIWPSLLDKVKNPYPDGFQFTLGVIVGSAKLGVIVGYTEDGAPIGELFNRQPSDRDGKRFKVVDGEEVSFQEWDVVLLQKFPKSNGGFFFRIASTPTVQGGIVVIDNITGEVLATSGGFSVGAGGRYRGAGGNRAFTAYRQPGSTVKPFVYLHALEKGVAPFSSISNQDLTLPIRYNRDRVRVCDAYSLGGRNSELSSYSLRGGLEGSINRATVHSLVVASGVTFYDPKNLSLYSDQLSVGLDELHALMQEFGLYGELVDPCYPMLLGAHEMTVKDMAASYAAIANGGVYNPVATVTSVRRGGEEQTVFPQKSAVDYAISLSEMDPRRSFNLHRLRTFMQGVLARGTSKKISRWSDVIAGKTGTTNSRKDVWFSGFNKHITVTVWVGHPENKPLAGGSEGATVALPIFEDFMEQYYKKFPEKLEDKFETTFKGLEGLELVQIEATTGYLVSERFKQDYMTETGRELNVNTGLPNRFDIIEEPVWPGDTVAGIDYKPKSRAVGELFWKKMTPERREDIEYGDSYGGDIDSNSYQGYQIQFLQNAVRCANAISYNENATNGALNQTASDGIFCKYIKEQLDIVRGDHGPHFNWFVGQVNACRASDVPVKACDEVKANGLSIKEYYLRNQFGYVEEE